MKFEKVIEQLLKNYTSGPCKEATERDPSGTTAVIMKISFLAGITATLKSVLAAANNGDSPQDLLN